MGEALRLGTFSPSVVLRVAREAGVLQRFGLEVTEVPVASSPAQFAALLDGDLDAVLTSPDNVVAYRFVPDNPLGRTADVRILLGVDRGLGLALYGRPGVGSLDDLRGATVGVDVAGSGFAFVLYDLLTAAGLRRGHDYELAELGSTPRRLEALLDGRCAATMLNAGNELRAQAAGATVLGRATDVASPYLGTVLAATGGACTHDAIRLTALVGAVRATLATLHAGGARDLAVAQAATALRLDPTLAARYVDGLRDPAAGLLPDGDPDDTSLAAVVALRRRHHPTGAAEPLASVTFDGLVDRSLLAAAAAAT